MRYEAYVCLIVSDYVYMCLVLFVVSKIPDSSELLCLLEMGVEYYLVCIKSVSYTHLTLPTKA